MSPVVYFALFFTVALLVTTAYFMMGSLPLLILKHDTPVDARFIRGFFNTSYLAAMGVAIPAAASYALWGRAAFALGAAAIALAAAVLRRKVLSAMDQLRAEIPSSREDAVRRFRRVHATAILINLLQLVLIVWSLTTFRL